MGALCGRGSDEEEKYAMNLALLPLLDVTPQRVHQSLFDKGVTIDSELKLLRNVLDVVNEEAMLKDASFCHFGCYMGLRWVNWETGNSMHLFVGDKDVQTRLDRRGGGDNAALVLCVTNLGLKPEADDFVDKLRESLRDSKRRMDEPLDKVRERLNTK
jgi:hypothetical protein